MKENFTAIDKDELRRLQQNSEILEKIKDCLRGRFARRNKLNLVTRLNRIKNLTEKVST